MAEVEYPRRLLRKQAVATSAGAAYDDLEFGPVPEGEQWWVQNVAAVDEDNGATKIGVFVKTRAGSYWINERVFTTAAQRRRVPGEFRVRDGEFVVVRVTGAIANDVLRGWLVGNYEEAIE